MLSIIGPASNEALRNVYKHLWNLYLAELLIEVFDDNNHVSIEVKMKMKSKISTASETTTDIIFLTTNNTAVNNDGDIDDDDDKNRKNFMKRYQISETVSKLPSEWKNNESYKTEVIKKLNLVNDNLNSGIFVLVEKVSLYS